MSNADLTRSPFADTGIRLSLFACLLGFGGFVFWSAFAKLDEGVTASGQVVVQENRKSIQHFEGGIIRTLNVKEGDKVTADEVLLVLEPVQSEAARDELAQEFAAQSATLARLTALRTEADQPDFSVVDEAGVPPVTKADIIARQTTLFREQRGARAAELRVLNTRKSTLSGRQRDLSRQITATASALESARKHLARSRNLLAEKFETIGNVERLEREVAGYEADLSRLVGDRNEAQKTSEEIDSQIVEAHARFQEELSTQIIEAQARSLGARERLLALDDRLARTVIKAPQTGTVLNLAHSTIGGVVGPGEVIMEIVPDTGDLIVTVRLSPTDRDAVAPGQDVEAQMTAYKSFIAPRLPGKVLGVSADLKQDEATGTFYYEARVSLDASELDPTSRIEIIPGMPVEAFIASGNSRTFLDYVFEPIRATISRGTRMS